MSSSALFEGVSTTCSSSVDKRWLDVIGGQVFPTSGWGKSLGFAPSVSYSVLDQYVLTVGVAAQAKRESWIMFRENHVRGLELSSGDHPTSVFARCYVRASFLVRVLHRVAIMITPEVRVHAFYCSCAAGASGACKHGVAALFRLWDLEQQGCDTVPRDLAVTELPAY